MGVVGKPTTQTSTYENNFQNYRRKKKDSQIKMSGIIAYRSILQEILKEFHQAEGYQTESWIWERK